MKCVICEVCKVEKNSADPDVCIGCQKRIKLKVENPMEYARAYGMLLDSYHNEEKRQESVNAAGIDLFFPDMPRERRRELIENMNRKKK